MFITIVISYVNVLFFGIIIGSMNFVYLPYGSGIKLNYNVWFHIIPLWSIDRSHHTWWQANCYCFQNYKYVIIISLRLGVWSIKQVELRHFLLPARSIYIASVSTIFWGLYNYIVTNYRQVINGLCRFLDIQHVDSYYRFNE
jgi:hypothetical protein